MIDPASADAYYADWNGRIVTPSIPPVTVLTPVKLTDAEREALVCDCQYDATAAPHGQRCASLGEYDAVIQPDLLVERVERIVAARLLQQATR